MIPADPLAKLGPATILRADARALPLPDASVDLVVTSPPYFGLRSYTDGGLHYDGQIGSETTPAEFVAALLDCTREMARVLKPSASLWVNLGDKYASYEGSRGDGGIQTNRPRPIVAGGSGLAGGGAVRTKSLMGIPWRYALACIGADTALADPDVVNLLLRDVALGVLTLAEAAQVVDDLADYDRWDLGLILRAEVIWSKPNGLPESVTDRVRRSHETWFHFVKQPRYFAGVDEIRDPLAAKTLTHGGGGKSHGEGVNHYTPDAITTHRDGRGIGQARVRRPDPRGALPGSVREIAATPLKVPQELGVDHFAAFPAAWPAWIIRGWSPAGICTACGEGRRPVVDARPMIVRPSDRRRNAHAAGAGSGRTSTSGTMVEPPWRQITGYACACASPDAPSTPAVVLDPFGGTGTTAMAARALGRHGISVDRSADYCRLARWRCTDLDELAVVRGLARADRTTASGAAAEGQTSLFDAWKESA